MLNSITKNINRRLRDGNAFAGGGGGIGSLDTILFNIDHETGDLSQWDTTQVDGGDLSASLTAGMNNSLAVIGSELVTNGTFAAWTDDNPDGFTVSGESGSDPEVSEVGTGEGHGGSGTGLCNVFTTSSNVFLTQAIAVEVGKTYRLTIDIDTVTTGEIQIRHSTSVDFSETYSTPGTKTIIFTASVTSLIIEIKRFTGSDDITIDNISVKEVTGATFGMQCTIDDTTVIYGQMTIVPPSSGNLRARFYIDPSQLEMVEADDFHICDIKTASVNLFQVRLLFNSGSHQLRIIRINDALSSAGGVSQNITAAEHCVEILCSQAATDSSSDGSLKMWIDGSLANTLSGIDNFDQFNLLAQARLGAVALIDAGTRGHLFLDEFVVRDYDKEIGA